MSEKRLLIPADRLSVVEHVQLFCDSSNYPLEVFVDSEHQLLYQNDLYNLLVRGEPVAVDSSLVLSLISHHDNDRIPEVHGELVVVDYYNCFMKQGEYWYPFRFQFVCEGKSSALFARGGFHCDQDHPIRWNTLVRFLRTFYPHRKKFMLYHSFAPMENYYTYLKSLYLEFKSIPSNELESLRETKHVRLRVHDELLRRRVLSSRV